MNTRQMIVLWLGGLGVASLLVVRLGTDGQVAALIVVTAMLVYSLGSHPRANKRKVLLAIGIAAVCGLGAGYTLLALRSRAAAGRQEQTDAAAAQSVRARERYPIDPKMVKVFDVEYNRVFPNQVQGRIQNSARRPVTYLTLHVAFRNAHKLLDEGDCTSEFNDFPDYSGVPTGETRSFTAFCPLFDIPWHEHISLDLQVKSVMTSER